MMNQMKTKKTFFEDKSYYYILFAAVLACLFMALGAFAQPFFEYGFVIPCMLFMGIQLGRGSLAGSKKIFVLPGLMVAWFLFLQAKRNFEYVETDNISLFIAVYLFAFPLASVLRKRDGKKALKIFAGAYLAGTAIMSVEGLLLILDRLPQFMDWYVYWDGDRLAIFWHPNITGYLMMIGIMVCTVFLLDAKHIRSKIALSVLLVVQIGMLALTSCRTATILTGGYLGSVVFYMLIKRGWKWFIPAALAAILVLVAFYSCERYVYQANSDRLINGYIQEYWGESPSTSVDSSMVEAEMLVEETVGEITGEFASPENNEAEEALSEEYFDENAYEEVPVDKEEIPPIWLDFETGEINLITSSAQGNIAEDLGTFNSRTGIWRAAVHAICDTPSILYWGVRNPGEYVSEYNAYPVAHLHNAWIECLVGMGLVGFLIALLFTVMTAWNCLVVLLRHYQDIWKRSAALLALCLLAASILEPCLFYTMLDFKLMEFIFFLCAGYLAYWQEEDNRCVLRWIRNRVPLLKK